MNCYDPIGNRRTATAVSGLTSNVSVYAANSLNQYSQITNNGALITPQYDLDGNMTSYGEWRFAWDAENRMTGASNTAVGGTSATVVVNSYDFMSRRVRKIAGVVTNDFLYDGWNLISEISVGGAQSITNRYVWGLDLSGTQQGAGGIGGLLSVIRNGATYSPCYDANGNITDYVDQNGVVVAHREYDAYGNTVVSSGPMANDFSFWFSSKYLDQETGLYYYGYRYYGPDLGVWLSRDPIGLSGGINLHEFVGNSPVNKFDPFGLLANDMPRVSAPCCGGRIYTPSTSCCHNNEVIPVVTESSTSYKVCCRAVRYDPATDPWWGRWVYPRLRHCDIRSGPCDSGEESYDITKSDSGSMDNGKPCRCSNSGDISSCLERNPYDPGSGNPGSNCQANTYSRLQACCLKSNWSPNIYGYPL